MLKLTITDILLTPVYLVLFNLGLGFINKRINHNKVIAGYFSKGFKIKLLFGIFFGLFSIFLLPGDTEMYYTGGIDFKNIIFDNPHNLRFLTAPAREFGSFYEAGGYRPENYGYISAESNLMAMKFVALFSLFSFNSYIVISMFFSLFSFFGLWCMFKTFYKIYPRFYTAIFMTFFLIPSVLFWGSGILKDTLCLGFLGIGFYNSYLFFLEKRYHIKTLIAFVISFYCLYTLKSYIAFAFIPCFIFWYLLRTISAIQNKALKLVFSVTPLIILVLYLSLADLSKIIPENSVNTIAENILTTQKNYILTTPDDGALLDYGEITPTLAGILVTMPKALVASLFRPFLWEARKVTSLIAAVEGTFIFCLTIFVFFKKGILFTFKTIVSDSTIFFALIFSLTFATAIGLNCFNLGTLVRYKIPCLPFYILSLILILRKQHGDVKSATLNEIKPTA
jgi:hypothetical protein